MNQKISFNITDKQKEKIEKEADEKGLSTAGFCRFIIFRELKNGN